MPASQIYCSGPVVVAHASILTLPSLAVEIVPGIPNKILRMVNGGCIADISGGAYMNVTNSPDADQSSMSITTSASDNLLASNPVSTQQVLAIASINGWFMSPYTIPDEFTPASYLGDPYTGPIANSVLGEGFFLQAYNSDGDFTGGDAANALTITLYYTIIDV